MNRDFVECAVRKLLAYATQFSIDEIETAFQVIVRCEPVGARNTAHGNRHASPAIDKRGKFRGDQFVDRCRRRRSIIKPTEYRSKGLEAVAHRVGYLERGLRKPATLCREPHDRFLGKFG